MKLPEKIKKIYYCHTPPRYIFDLRERYLEKIPRFLHAFAHMILDRKAEKYKKLLANMDVIITNSETVQKRLYDFTGYESEIIYPPTDTDKFKIVNGELWTTEQEKSEIYHLPFTIKNYFLSFARLSPPKRVDLIVDAFLDMPEKNLVFTYGKNDPMREDIFAKICNSKNIKAIESPTDDELIHLIQWATATIYIPVEEDFGMSPVESMACGTPVIGAREGWLLETIIEWETGLLIEVNKENLKTAIRKMTPAYAESLCAKCVERAGEFSLEKFDSKIREKCI